MNTRCLLVGLALTALALTALAPSPVAAAAESTEAGWWTTSPVAVAPDAQGALVVQGGPQADQPQSFAAVQFVLGTGESAARLRLSAGPGSASTSGATLTVCPLTTTFTSVDGGAMADAPRYDCTAMATALPDATGAYTFDVTSLDVAGVLALAILPGAVTNRVVLTKPTGASLATFGNQDGAGAAPGDGNGLGAEGDGVVTQGPPITPDKPGTPSTWSFPIDSFEAPVTGLPVGTDQGTRSITATPPPLAQASSGVMRPTAATRDDRGVKHLAIALGCLALIATGLWMMAGRMAEEPGESNQR